MGNPAAGPALAIYGCYDPPGPDCADVGDCICDGCDTAEEPAGGPPAATGPETGAAFTLAASKL